MVESFKPEVAGNVPTESIRSSIRFFRYTARPAFVAAGFLLLHTSVTPPHQIAVPGSLRTEHFSRKAVYPKQFLMELSQVGRLPRRDRFEYAVFTSLPLQ
jgi:hypothetical protein